MTTTADKPKTDKPALDLSQGGTGWRPKKGSEVRGLLRSISRAWSDWANDFYPILTIEQDDGSLVDVHCFHSVLLSRVMSLKPKRGEYVGVKCHGEEKTKDGKRTVHLYSFDVSRPGSEDDDPYAAFESMAKASAMNGSGEPDAE